ncbi:MAG: hypothetical protein ABFS14_00190 [Gemmatimonadota bacterium]
MTRIRAAILFSLLTAAGCTEDAITDVSPEDAPGSSAPTVEIELRAADFVSFEDTTYVGYAIPGAAPFSIVADQDGLDSRMLARFSTIPDSVQVDTTLRVAVDSFVAASLRLVVDTVLSVLPDSAFAAPFSLSAFSLDGSFVEREATWSEASAGVPWMIPGGDLGALLGTLDLDTLTAETFPDTIFVPLSGNIDSLFTAWRATDGEPGLALSMEARGVVLQVSATALLLGAAAGDTVVQVARTPSEQTFIFDPPPPAVGLGLRLGGLPAARAYIRFQIPESVAGFALRGAVINDAVFQLRPLATPTDPFALTQSIAAGAFEVTGDPLTEGEKVPVGPNLGLGAEVLDPDSLAAGVSLEFPATALLQRWSSNDTIQFINLGLRTIPEGTTLGRWEFGSSQSAPAFQPGLRLIVTPPTEFELP